MDLFFNPCELFCSRSDGGFHNLEKDPPFDPFPFPVYEYMLYTFGYHVAQFLMNFENRHENDFHEMLLHHIAAFALYFSCTYGCFM